MFGEPGVGIAGEVVKPETPDPVHNPHGYRIRRVGRHRHPPLQITGTCLPDFFSLPVKPHQLAFRVKVGSVDQRAVYVSSSVRLWCVVARRRLLSHQKRVTLELQQSFVERLRQKFRFAQKEYMAVAVTGQRRGINRTGIISEQLVAFRMAPLNVGDTGRTERTYAQLVSGNFFDALRLTPAAGRFIRSEEVERPGAEPVVVISHDYWQTHFAGSPSAIGQTLRVNENHLTIIGVAPQDFQGTILALQFDLWVPATLAPSLFAGSNELTERNSRGYSVMGRLRDGANEARATGEFLSAMGELATAFPESNGRIGGELMPYWRAPRGPQMMFITALGVLQGVMLLVLLAVCGNTANLVLARASARYREVGVRLALGAGPGSVIRLMLAENLLLGLLGAAVGILIAWWGTEALRAMPPYGAFPVRFQTSLDGIGLAFAVMLGILSGLLFGAAPAYHLGRIDPQQALRSGSKSSGRSTVRDGLMALQCGLALLVLVVAGLFFQSFIETRDTNPGFRTEGLLLAEED